MTTAFRFALPRFLLLTACAFFFCTIPSNISAQPMEAPDSAVPGTEKRCSPKQAIVTPSRRSADVRATPEVPTKRAPAPPSPKAPDSAVPRVIRRQPPRLPGPTDSDSTFRQTEAKIPDGSYRAVVWSNSENLKKLAASAGVSSSELLKINRLRSSELREGQVLRVPLRGDSEAVPPRLDREVWRGIRGRKQIALTFDAGGENTAAKELLGHLKDAGVPATFFVTGEFAAKNSQLLKDMAKIGPVYNHSWSHPEFTSLSVEAIREELERTDWAIRDLTGKPTKPYWRPPFGDRDTRVLRVAADTGYQSIYWTLDCWDSIGEKKDARFIRQRVLYPPSAKDDPDYFLDGAIVLMHVGETGTVEALPSIISELQNRGFTLVTVDDLLKP